RGIALRTLEQAATSVTAASVLRPRSETLAPEWGEMMSLAADTSKGLLRTIKQLMRQRKLRYRDLAEKLGLSESAVKRFFSAGDGSFSRVLEICGILDVELSDLLQESKKVEYTQVHFTIEQQKYLTKRREHIAVYWYLLINELSVEEIKQKFQLSEKAMTTILRELDRLDLIEWSVGGKVKPKKRSPWFGQARGP
ncbi:MAG: helix-turn-helix domain-containing protein, partial [Pseudomonadota bacterium]